MKNKVTRIGLSSCVDRISVYIERKDSDGEFFLSEYTAGEFTGISYDSADRFMLYLTNGLQAGTWKATGIKDIGAFNVEIRVWFESVKPQESFEIMSVSREDLDRLGFDTSAVDDSTMHKIANKLSEGWMDTDGFYDGLEYLGTKFEIPRPNPKSIYDDEE